MKNLNSSTQMQEFYTEVRKRLWLSVIILLIVSIIVFPYNYMVKHHSKAQYVQNIPLNIGNWKGIEIPLDKLTLEILGTDDVAIRRYSHDLMEVPPVDLAIVFSQEDRGAVHPPEVCYTGGGWDVQVERYVTLNFAGTVIKAVELIIKMDETQQLVIYWYKSGNKYTGNYYLQQLNVVVNQLLHKKSSSVLIRLSIPLPDKDVDKGLSRLCDFGETLFPYLEEYIP